MFQEFRTNIFSEIEHIFHKMTTKLRASLLLFSLAGIAGIAFYLAMGQTPPPANPDKEAALVRTILSGMERLHFQPKEVNDEFSRQLYQLYLQDLDNGKRFFTQADIAQLAPFETQLDDEARNGVFDFFNLSVKLYEAALEKTQKWYREILAQPLDFNAAELLETDGKKLKWAKDDAELRDRWHRWMKYEVLNRINIELRKQEKADFTGEKKSFEILEKEQREKTLETYDRFFKRLKKADRARRLELYLDALTNVFDPHSGYYSPKEKENFDIQMSGKLEGIGARLQSDGEKTTIVEIVPGGPAWKQGDLQAKDVVLKVAQGAADINSEDIMGWEIDDVVSKIRGPKGSKVTLTIQKPDGAIKVVTIQRDVVIMEEGLAKSLLLKENKGDAPLIGYIYLPKFYADFTPQGATSCAADAAKEIEKLKSEQVKGIILDLRNNGGGSLRDVVQMSGLFIEQGPIVQVKSRNRKAEVMEDSDSRVQWDGPLVVMVNSFSASASEILAAAMQDYKRAVIVGAVATYGKGTVQRFLDLDNAVSDPRLKPMGEMKLTVQKFYRINGSTTQLNGVKPDIVLPDFYNLIEVGERENEFPLQANSIEPATYGQRVYLINNMDALAAKSKERVTANQTFQKVNENAERLRRQREQTTYPLQADQFRLWSKRQSEEAEQFENMFQPIDGFVLENLRADMQQINADTSRQARNENWIKDKKKDIQLYEAYAIIWDMISLGNIASRKN